MSAQHPPVVVRRATLADADAVLACLAAAFASYRDQYSPAAFEDTTLARSTIETRMREMNVFVAEAEGLVVGTIAAGMVSSEEGHLRGMAVLPESQGRGVADQLLAAAEAHLCSRGCTRVTLDTTAPLKRAIGFYEKHGYRATGKVGDFYGMLLYEYAKTLAG